VPGYNVSVSNLPSSEVERNLEMLRFISDEAAGRGLDFQLGLWTHAYEWAESSNANHAIFGLTPKTHAAYCRDALALLLKECPNITGVTFRIHGESGVPEEATIFGKLFSTGVFRAGGAWELTCTPRVLTNQRSKRCWRRVCRSPSRQNSGRNTWVCPTTRRRFARRNWPIRAAAAGRCAKRGARSFLRYGYGDLLREDRRYEIVHRVWPGTQRVLLWGDPVFAAAYSRAFSFCGSQGCEIFDPLSFKGRKGSGLPGGRDGYADPSLQPAEAILRNTRSLTASGPPAF